MGIDIFFIAEVSFCNSYHSWFFPLLLRARGSTVQQARGWGLIRHVNPIKTMQKTTPIPPPTAEYFPPALCRGKNQNFVNWQNNSLRLLNHLCAENNQAVKKTATRNSQPADYRLHTTYLSRSRKSLPPPVFGLRTFFLTFATNMNKTIDLTTGPIFKQLLKLAIPIIGTSLMRMAYNLTDMIWLGRLGSDAVASVGSAGFYVWLGISVLLITRIGAEVGVSQSLGRKDKEEAARYARHSLFWALILSVLISVTVLVITPQLTSVFRLSKGIVEDGAIGYLRIVSMGFVFTFMNPTFQGIYNGVGNSKLPFYYLLVGLGLNMVLDPVLIFGIGKVPALGINGAAMATVIAQAVVFMIFIIRFVWKKEIMQPEFRNFKLSKEISKNVFKLGSPVAIESSLFAVFALILARMITKWGDMPIAVQSVGAQIEALSWMTSSGFATALGSFTGQNFGAKNWERIRKGYFTTLGIGIFLGTLVTLSFFVFGKQIFSLFLKEPEPLQMGITYLKILAISQTFMIIEIITRGAFNGIGRTIPPSVIGIVFTGARVPGAFVLSSAKLLGMFGIWWAISLSSVVKGIVSFSWYITVLRKKSGKPRKNAIISLIPNRLRQQFSARSRQ